VDLWEWFPIGEGKAVSFGFHIDSLTTLWMLFVTLLATLIALYASEYMSGDVGPNYCRFFAAFNLFVFSMACLVMGSNLLMLFLGWEGVGLCSYLLIGYFFKKPSAVNAAKKAFIVNRVGDLGLLVGIFLIFNQFGTLTYSELFSHPQLLAALDAMKDGRVGDIAWQIQLIPALLMVGAFGKSAQLPLYVWLPDAMEGPTPVSALIHAATMVTAGVYLIARTYPMFLASEYALPIVAWVGALTALLAATIAMAQYDIKRIMAYSTVSQLGYMFCGLAFLSSAGGAYHVFTHAFFKATLFLCCGAVMHGFAGQLDLRKLSGVMFMPGWLIVGVAMLVGCLNLAGFPFTAGYFSKDMILAEAFVTPGPGYPVLGWVLLLTAGLTAYYTFRVFFRVFVGPKSFEPGDELHGDHGHDHAHDEHAHDGHGGHDAHGVHGDDGHDAPHAPSGGDGHGHGHGFHPHAPGWAINTVLIVLIVGSVAAAAPYFMKGPDDANKGWVGSMLSGSPARQIVGEAAHDEAAREAGSEAGVSDSAGADKAHGARLAAFVPADSDGHGSILGMDPHKAMYYISAVIGGVGIAVAFGLHFAGRRTSEVSNADKLLEIKPVGTVHRWANRKWYVDEFYNMVIRTPLWVGSHIMGLIDMVLDRLFIDELMGKVSRYTGQWLRPTQSGVLHSYASAMVLGVVVIFLLVLLVVTR